MSATVFELPLSAIVAKDQKTGSIGLKNSQVNEARRDAGHNDESVGI
tara:strand:- start:236 stop:376 length:141 start_codon:yes stop_codon:yes gene_type:complete